MLHLDAAEELRPGSGVLVQVLAYGGLRWGEAVAIPSWTM